MNLHAKRPAKVRLTMNFIFAAHVGVIKNIIENNIIVLSYVICLRRQIDKHIVSNFISERHIYRMLNEHPFSTSIVEVLC